MKEKEDERQLELKVKNILTHEIHMDQELSKLQEEMTKIYYEDFKQIRKLEFTIIHNSRYMSRKWWRMEILKDYMHMMNVAINLAYGGEIGMSASAEIMAAIGVKGSSNVKFLMTEHDDNNFYCRMYFDIGTYTSTDRTFRNDSTAFLQARNRLYIVSAHFLEGTPITMAEVRVIKSITDSCLIMVHTTLNTYRVVVGGNITCIRFGQSKTLLQMKAGEMLHLDGRDICRNECIEVGYKGYNRQHKELPPQPSIQPASLQHFFQEVDEEKMPAPMKSMELLHQVSHDILATDIRENEDMLMQLSQPRDDYVPYSAYSGYFGAALSVLLAIVFLAMCIKCHRRRAADRESIEMRTYKELSRREDKGEEEESQ